MRRVISLLTLEGYDLPNKVLLRANGTSVYATRRYRTSFNCKRSGSIRISMSISLAMNRTCTSGRCLGYFDMLGLDLPIENIFPMAWLIYLVVR